MRFERLLESFLISTHYKSNKQYDNVSMFYLQKSITLVLYFFLPNHKSYITWKNFSTKPNKLISFFIHKIPLNFILYNQNHMENQFQYILNYCIQTHHRKKKT